ncbi:MAG: M48 family metallopeptidase [Blastocatellia bacterium]
MGEWQRQLLRKELPGLIAKWEGKQGVHVKGCFVQRIKTKWGGCNYRSGTISLNSELVEKPKDFLEYVIVHGGPRTACTQDASLRCSELLSVARAWQSVLGLAMSSVR